MAMGRSLRTALVTALLICAPFAGSYAADEKQSLEELRNTVINLLQALVDQGVISREKAAQLVKAAQDKAAADASAVAKADEGAVRVPYVPQIVKDEIAKQVADQIKPGVVADVVKEAKTERWGVPGALDEFFSRVHFSGGVTLREEDILFAKDNLQFFYPNYQAINSAGSIAKAPLNGFLETDINRARFRGRARFGLEADITNSVTAGIRFSTGTLSGDPVSQTQTLDGTAAFQTGLDQLYIRLDERNAQKFPWLSVVGGRFANPWQAPTDLIFHKDLMFNGVSATGRIGFGDGSAEQSHAFITAGVHPLQEIQLSSRDKMLVGGQVGANLRWGAGQRLRIAGAFYDYLNVTGRRNSIDAPGFLNYTAPAFIRQGNTYFDISADPTTSNLFALASKFRLIDVNMIYELPLGRYTFKATSDAVKNVGYRSEDITANLGVPIEARTKGYQAELSFGYPNVSTAGFGAWRALMGYRYLQRDAVIDAYTDSDFHLGGTDATGYYFIGELGLANKLWMRLRYQSANAIEDPKLYGVDTIQLDLNTRF